jgi:hypothetical protein
VDDRPGPDLDDRDDRTTTAPDAVRSRTAARPPSEGLEGRIADDRTNRTRSEGSGEERV